MKISIHTRLRPFSHLPGAKCLIPGTNLVVEAFPTRLCMGSLEIPIPYEESIREFTLQQDLERNCVWVFGKQFRLKIMGRPEGVEIKGLCQKTMFFPIDLSYFMPKEWERLCLGSHKTQDLSLVLRRFDCKEILPLLFGLGQKVPSQQKGENISDLEKWCREAFHHMLSPCKTVLSDAFATIRALFFREDGDVLHILQNNLFASGRMTNLQTKFGSLDIEWVKKQLCRLILRSNQKTQVRFLLHPEMTSFRMKTCGNDKGVRCSVADPFLLEANKVYFLDQFFCRRFF